jgi:2'-5' RNA ligase
VSAERARLFVALDLPEDVRESVAGWQRVALGGIPELRVVPREALHVTLCFMGWRMVEEADPIGAAMTAVAAPVPEVELAGALWLPRRRPRVLALEVSDGEGACARLQSAVSEALVRGAWFEPERRPFFPHVTVARVRGGAARGFGARPVSPEPPAPRFEGAALTLYRSRPTASGATYEPLARAPLAAT